MIDVCVCTHNPKPELFSLILTAIANQTLSKDAYQVWIVDNASEPIINDEDLRPLAMAGVNYHLLQEPRLGTMYARELISQTVPGEALVLVDDDNELLPNYLEVAIDILNQYPEIAYFGGKLLSGIKVDYPAWMDRVLPYLGIKDEGDQPISKCIEGDYYWGKWEPPCAGAVIRKVVLQKYFEQLQKLPPDVVLGRQGKTGLLSMADSWLAHCTYELGLECAYQPRLKLIHHIDPARLKLEYFLRLLYNYGRSQVIFKRILNQPLPTSPIDSMAEKIQWWKSKGVSNEYFLCLLAWEAGFTEEVARDQPIDPFKVIAAAWERQDAVPRKNTALLKQQVIMMRNIVLWESRRRLVNMKKRLRSVY
jgi:hypothetical protein